MPNTPSVPRASLAALSLLHAAVLGAAAYVLPWPSLSMFAILGGATAAGYLVTFTLSVIGSERRAVAWRLTSLLSIGFLGYVTYAALGSGLYVNLLYEGVGAAILAAAVAAWCVAVLFLLPLSLWGIAKTGGLFRRRRKAGAVGGGAAIVGGGVLLAFSLAANAGSARGRAHLLETPRELDDLAIAEFASLREAPDASDKAPSLFVAHPVDCPVAPHESREAVAFVTFLDTRAEGEPVAETVCVAGDNVEAALRAARDTLSARQAAGDAVVDVVTSSRTLPDAGPLLGSVIVRPGIEGVCDASRCLLPWQLFGLDAFTDAANISALQAEIGVTAKGLRKLLGEPPADDARFVGLDAITTRTYLVRAADRSVTPLRHLRSGMRPLDHATLDGALDDAAAFVVSSQVKDGRFRYTVQPFDAKVSFENFSVPRQAGTTLSLCDANAHSKKARDAARASLKFLVSLEQQNENLGGIIFPKGKKDTTAPLGSTALTLVALLSCRAHVGKDFDETIVRLGNALVAMQREDGGFHPAWSPATGKAVPGRDALYAAGQAVFALVLWEGNEGDGLPRPQNLKAAIDRAMAYYSGPYWNIPLRDFFYLEENWHCLAARAALTHHRNDRYERFCTDYMTMKMRFIQSPSSGVDEDHVGAYAFGHVFPPHHAAAAGFAEALAASIAIKRFRKEPTDKEEQVLRWTLSYLLRHQWRQDNCFMCTKKLRIAGGFSENAASPIIRIDFVQHAMAGLLNGGRVLGLVDG
ncbi:MAG: hypothetical protein HOW73_23475 [Polyangiaceae bacterium]|nr:hypothetical protein [Polyangiaceae bacterium]